MYNHHDTEKHCAPPRNAGGMKHRKRLWTGIALALALCCVVSGITLAYIFTNTAEVKNEFVPAEVSCEVVETFDGETKSDVTIKNTGKTDSYIRAAIVVTWMSEDGTQVSATKPIAGTDYSVTFASGTAWEASADGFWYFKNPVAVGATTDVLIESCTCLVTPPEGFYLSVEIVASAIQASPTTVVTTNWSSGVSGVNGTTLVIK